MVTQRPSFNDAVNSGVTERVHTVILKRVHPFELYSLSVIDRNQYLTCPIVSCMFHAEPFDFLVQFPQRTKGKVTNMNNLIKVCAHIVFGKWLPRLAYPVICGPLKGAKFILGTFSGDCGGVAAYCNMIEPEQTSTFVDTLKKGQVFFDIGANVGYYTILGARIVGSQGKVFAFEPVIRNLAYLYQHTVLNKANNVTLVSAACSDTISLTLFSGARNFAEGHINDNILLENEANNLLFPVPTVTVDAMVQQLGVTPDVIKIDVEGAELSVLRGAQGTLREAKPKIFLSTHSDMLRSTCLEYLEELGYTFEVMNHDNRSEFLAQYAKA